MENADRHNVTQAQRAKKYRTLRAKIKKAQEHGVTVHTDLIVLDYHDGKLPQFQRWNGEDWEIVKL